MAQTLLSNAVKTLWKAKKQREAFKRRGRVSSRHHRGTAGHVESWTLFLDTVCLCIVWRQVMASERGLSMQLSWALKKITNRMVQIRKERRSPLTEAYYNGNFQVVPPRAHTRWPASHHTP